MDILKNIYPEFKANQILTHEQLNLLKHYLEKQDRLSRVRLSGTGIVCGLEVDTTNSNSITVSGGFGVTSEGYILEFSTTTFKKFRKYQDLGKIEDEEKPYTDWTDTNILELTEKSGSNISSQTKENQVLVLYLEKREVQLDSCMVTDCNSKGKNIHANIRALLIKESDLTAIPDCTSVKKLLLSVPRLHTILPLEKIEKAEQINDIYNEIIHQFIENQQIEKNLIEAFNQFSNFISFDESHQIEALYKQFKDTLGNAETNQYHYDLLKDFVQAYNELIKSACQIAQACQQPSSNFPRHLLLGSFDGDTGFRHHFTASATHTLSHTELGRLDSLFERFAMIASNKHPENEKFIVITPSHTTRYPLGKRAVPFYLEPEIFPFWQPETCCTTDEIWSYHNLKNEVLPFNTDYDNCSLLRIEGHLGRPVEEVVKSIEELRRQNNLEFDLIHLQPGRQDEEDTHDFRKFVQETPGLEHTAGVVKGGTFIIISNERNQVLADFSLEGQIPCCRDIQPVKNGGISGRVIDENDNPFPSASVSVTRNDNSDFKKNISTDRNGLFQFLQLPVGLYSLLATVKLENGASKTRKQTGEVIAGQTTPVEFIIPRDESTLSGHITGIVQTEDQKPVVGATITLSPTNKKQTSGNAGDFSFKDVKPRNYSLVANHTVRGKKFLSKAVTVSLAAGETEKRTLVLIPQSRQPEFRIPDELIAHVSTNMGFSEAQANKSLLTVYTSRQQNYLELINSAPATVKRTNAWKISNEFVSNDIPNITSSDEIAPNYDAAAKQALEKLSGIVNRTNKLAYTNLLRALIGAMLDSISRSHPNDLSNASVKLVRSINQTMKDAKLKPAEFKTQWEGEQLVNTLKIGSIKRIMRLLR